MTIKAFLGASDRIHKDSAIGEYVQRTLDMLRMPDHYVEIRIFPTRSAMVSSLTQVLEESLPSSALGVPDFATYHESFAGYPRIWVSLDEMDLGKPIPRARLQHEVGHAVLHWEISSYLLGVPKPLRLLVEKGKVPSQEASMMSYLLSIGLKDFEVSELLERNKIGKDQISFYAAELKEPYDTPSGMLQALGNLKIILAAYPFRNYDPIKDLLEESLRRFGKYQALVRGIASDLVDNSTLKLEGKMELAARSCSSVLCPAEEA